MIFGNKCFGDKLSLSLINYTAKIHGKHCYVTENNESFCTEYKGEVVKREIPEKKEDK